MPSRTKLGLLVEFLAVGGSTVLLLPLAWLCQRTFGLDASELAVGFLTFHAATVLNDPHFAVTYLLFYRRVRQRAFGPDLSSLQRGRYWCAGALVPAALVTLATVAIRRDSAPLLGALVQLMFVLVGWHYVKQAFGVLAVLSARRGIRLSSFERHALLVHGYASWLYALLSPADPGTAILFKGVLHTSLPHPEWLAEVSLFGFALSGVGVLIALVACGRKRRRAAPLLPLCAMLGSVWCWTVFTRIDPVFYYLIPALHSVQYLYFVGLLARNEARHRAGPIDLRGRVRFRLVALALASVGLGWLLLRGLPSFLDRTFMLGPARDPAEMAFVGPTPFLAAFVTIVNVHHYFMDWVIWRRGTPEMRYLAEDSSVLAKP